MAGQKRIYHDASKFYFITTKTFHNPKVFTEERIVRVLVGSLRYLQEKRSIKIFAWVILPDHVYLLFEIIGDKNVSQVMHDFKSYTVNKISPLLLTRRQGFDALPGNIRGSRGVEASAAGVERKYVKLWQTSFRDHIIRDQRDLYAHLDYIHYNPVKHRYVSKPEDFPWSSYRTFLQKGYYEKGWGVRVPSISWRIKE